MGKNLTKTLKESGVVKGCPLEVLIREHKKLHLSGFDISLVVYVCNFVWPEIQLINGDKWPNNGTFDLDIISQMLWFLQENKREQERLIAEGFYNLALDLKNPFLKNKTPAQVWQKWSVKASSQPTLQTSWPVSPVAALFHEPNTEHLSQIKKTAKGAVELPDSDKYKQREVFTAHKSEPQGTPLPRAASGGEKTSAPVGKAWQQQQPDSPPVPPTQRVNAFVPPVSSDIVWIKRTECNRGFALPDPKTAVSETECAVQNKKECVSDSDKSDIIVALQGITKRLGKLEGTADKNVKQQKSVLVDPSEKSGGKQFVCPPCTVVEPDGLERQRGDPETWNIKPVCPLCTVVELDILVKHREDSETCSPVLFVPISHKNSLTVTNDQKDDLMCDFDNQGVAPIYQNCSDPNSFTGSEKQPGLKEPDPWNGQDAFKGVEEKENAPLKNCCQLESGGVTSDPKGSLQGESFIGGATLSNPESFLEGDSFSDDLSSLSSEKAEFKESELSSSPCSQNAEPKENAASPEAASLQVSHEVSTGRDLLDTEQNDTDTDEQSSAKVAILQTIPKNMSRAQPGPGHSPRARNSSGRWES